MSSAVRVTWKIHRQRIVLATEVKWISCSQLCICRKFARLQDVSFLAFDFHQRVLLLCSPVGASHHGRCALAARDGEFEERRRWLLGRCTPLSAGQILCSNAEENVWLVQLLVSSVREGRPQVSAFTVVLGKYVLRADGMQP